MFLPQADPSQDYDTLTVLSAALKTLGSELLKQNSDMWQPFGVSALETKRAFSALHAEQVAVRQESVSQEVVLVSLELGTEVGRGGIGVGAG